MISDFLIPATNRSPEVSMSANGRLRISGKCIMEFPDEFYAPVVDWVTEYCMEPAEETVIELSVEFTTGVSTKKIYEILKKLKEVTLEGKQLVVNFFYESDDENMHDLGQFLQERLEIPVNLKEVEQIDLPVMIRPPSTQQSNNLTSE